MKLENRTEKPNKLRREGLVPGVIYGKKLESTSVQISEKKLLESFKKYQRSTVFDVTLDGKKHKVYFKDISTSPVDQNKVTHFSLLKVYATDTITADVPINVVGKEHIESKNLLVQLIIDTLEIEFNPGKGVQELDIDVSKLDVGDAVYVKDIETSEAVKVLTNSEEMVLNISHPEIEKDTTPDTTMEEPDVVGEDGEDGEGEGGEQEKEPKPEEKPKDDSKSEKK